MSSVNVQPGSEGAQAVCVKKENSSSTLCVLSSLSVTELEAHKHKIAATFVDRRSKDNAPLMTSTAFIGMVEPGKQVNMSQVLGAKAPQQGGKATPSCSVSNGSTASAPGLTSVSSVDSLDSVSSSSTTSSERSVAATWRHRDVEQGTSGRDASVFGGLGVLSIEHLDMALLNIPYNDAGQVTPQFLQAYGAQLVPVEQTFTLGPTGDTKHETLNTLYVTEYTWNQNYVPDYVMREDGGGGLFVETHPFPHIFTPLEPTCGGVLILGRPGENAGEINFAAFSIPYGYSMVVNSDVIHGDSFFTGKYAIALTETELADSVLIKEVGEKSARDMQSVSPYISPVIYGVGQQRMTFQVKALINPQYKNAVEFCARAIAEQCKHEKTTVRDSRTQRFFKELPQEVLRDMRSESPYLQQEFDKRGGLIVKPTM